MRFEIFGSEGLGFEAEGAVAEVAEAVVEEFVDGAGEGEVFEADVGEDVAVGGVQAKGEVFAAGADDVFEHFGVTVLGEGLEVFAEVAVVAVRADGDASAHGGVEVAGVAAPLLEGVAFEEEFVEFGADLGEDDFFGVGGVFDGDAFFGEPGFHFGAGGGAAEDLLEGVEVDGEVVVAAVGVRENLVIDGVPLGELGEVVADFGGVGAEVVGSVGVDEDAGAVGVVIGVAADVGAFVDDEAPAPELGAEAFGEDEAGETGADDEVVVGQGSVEERGWLTAARRTRRS